MNYRNKKSSKDMMQTSTVIHFQNFSIDYIWSYIIEEITKEVVEKQKV